MFLLSYSAELLYFCENTFTENTQPHTTMSKRLVRKVDLRSCSAQGHVVTIGRRKKPWLVTDVHDVRHTSGELSYIIEVKPLYAPDAEADFFTCDIQHSRAITVDELFRVRVKTTDRVDLFIQFTADPEQVITLCQ